MTSALAEPLRETGVVPFLLIRHGSVDYDAFPGRFRGHGIDLLPLTAGGAAEAEVLANAMAALHVDLILASPMTRSLQTAMIASWRIGCRVEVELDLHEWVPDRSQMWSGGDVPTAAYEELRRFGGEWPDGEERTWEPHSAVRARVSAVLDRYRERGTVAVVCHSGVIEALTGASGSPPCAVVPFELP